jgi:hypothetical protein
VFAPARLLFRLLGPAKARALHDRFDLPSLGHGKVRVACGWAGGASPQRPPPGPHLVPRTTPYVPSGPRHSHPSHHSVSRLCCASLWQGVGGYVNALLLAVRYLAASDSTTGAANSHKGTEAGVTGVKDWSSLVVGCGGEGHWWWWPDLCSFACCVLRRLVNRVEATAEADDANDNTSCD